jgi:phage terminase small subunit
MSIGRPPVPAALAALRGNPGKRPIRDEIQPRLASTRAPADLPEAAARIWAEFAGPLRRLRLFTILDRRALATACRLQALGEQLIGVAETTPTRSIRGHESAMTPEFRAALQALEAADRIWARFGVTPTERARLHPPPANVATPLADFLARKPRSTLTRAHISTTNDHPR